MTTPQDLERLSAYLDGQLSPAEHAQLESRFAREPELKAALDELQMVKRAVRGLPTMKIPRAFTLTPAQAGTRAPRVVPALRWAAALASLAFVFVFAGDLALNLSSGFGAAAPMVASRGESATRPAEAPVAADAGTGGSETAPASTPTAEAGMSALAGAPTETPAAKYAGESATPEAAAPTGLGAGAPPPSPATGTATSAPTPAVETFASAAPPPAPSETPLAVAQAPAATGESETRPYTPAPGLAPIRYLEIALAVLAVGLLAASFARR